MNTNDCRDYLINSKEAQQAVLDRYSFDDYEPGELDEETIAHFNEVRANAKKPQEWKRQRKYNVGSETDEIIEEFPALAGGVVREFWLKGTDHITMFLVEKDGKIVFMDDLSD